MTKSAILGKGMQPPSAPYSLAIEAQGRRTLHVSGQVPLDPTGNLVGKGDIRAQTVQVFENIKGLVEAAGGTMDNVVKVGIFVTDIRSRDTITEVRRQYLKEPFPAATMVEISRLVSPDWLVEIEAVAVLD
ncbi:MAG: RidA family protein [Candidatus Latescibacteria bacterium]|nr:RidA family protein [Candidatus Latescibacterota bacterium]